MIKKLCATLFFSLLFSQGALAFEEPFLLISSDPSGEVELRSFLNAAEEHGVEATLLTVESYASDFLEEEALHSLFLQKSSALEEAQTLVLWTHGATGLQLLSQLQNLEGKSVLFVTEAPFQLFRGLSKEEVFLFHSKDFLGILDGEFSEAERIYSAEGWRKRLLDFPLAPNAFFLLLSLPVIATLLAFLRQIFGFSTLGIFLPTLLTLGFLIVGLPYGLLFFFLLLLFDALARFVLNKLHFSGPSRSAMNIVFLSFELFFLFALSVLFSLNGLINVLLFVGLGFASFLESFSEIHSPKKHGSRLRIFLEMLFMCVLIYFVLEWDLFKLLLLSHPELLLVLPVVLYFLSRWNGLYLLEHFTRRTR